MLCKYLCIFRDLIKSTGYKQATKQKFQDTHKKKAYVFRSYAHTAQHIQYVRSKQKKKMFSFNFVQNWLQDYKCIQFMKGSNPEM